MLTVQASELATVMMMMMIMVKNLMSKKTMMLLLMLLMMMETMLQMRRCQYCGSEFCKFMFMMDIIQGKSGE